MYWLFISLSYDCCHQMSDFKAKMHQIRFRLGLCPRHRWESLQRCPRPLAGFKESTFKRKEGREWRKGEVRGWERRDGNGGQGRGSPPPPFQLPGPASAAKYTSSLLDDCETQSRWEMFGRWRLRYELRLTTRSGSASSDISLSEMMVNASPTSSPWATGLSSITGITSALCNLSVSSSILTWAQRTIHNTYHRVSGRGTSR